MSARFPVWLAWTACALSLALSVVLVAISLSNGELVSAVASRYSFALAFGLSFAPVGALIVSRRPRNPIGWLVLAAGLFNVLGGATYEYARRALIVAPGSLPFGDLSSWLAAWTWFPGLATLPIFLVLFPEGRLPSRRWRWVVWVMVFLGAVYLLAFAALWPYRGVALLRLGDSSHFPGTPAITRFAIRIFPLLFVVAAGGLASMVVRFRRSAGEERQQLKWLIYAGALVVIEAIVANIVETIGVFQVPQPLNALFVVTLPVALGVAMVRYRLYDIDVIINRTLVYGTLTVSLILVYLGSVVVLQYVLRAFTGENSQIVVVASTLVIAALFNPLRQRVQDLVDRRFYRRKYDAAKTMEAFSAKLREETDLGMLSEHLVGVVSETMRPAHVSLWLRPEAAPGDERAD